jgi:amphiphysin
VAERDYQNVNQLLKSQLPVFIQLRVQFIDSLLMSLVTFQTHFYFSLTTAYRPMEEYVQLHMSVIVGYNQRMETVLPMIEELAILKPLSPTSLQASPDDDWTTDANGNPFTKASDVQPPSYGSVVTSTATTPSPWQNANASTPVSPQKNPAAASGSTGNVSKWAAPAPTAKPAHLRAPQSNAASYATVLYDFDAQQEGDLALRVGEQVEVLAKTPDADGWWRGRINGREGIFPGNYVRLL